MDEARWYSNFGPLLSEFEERLAARFADETAIVTVSNATQALTLMLQAMDLPRGALCAVPSWTFVASAHAIVQAGLIPWFVDVDAETWMLDPQRLRADLASAPGPVCAVLCVAAHGAMPDLEAWLAFREQTGVPVLVDAAAAFDAAVDARLPMAVSLHATKVLGIGEGGFLATRDTALASRVRQMTSFGFKGSREALIVATNAKLSEYAGAVGLAAMDSWPADRQRFCFSAQLVRAALAMIPEVRFQPGWGADWAASVCVVGLPDAAAGPAAEALAEAGVDTRRWWGEGCHNSPAFQDFPRTALTVTERLARSSLGLPFAIDLSVEDIERIAQPLRRLFA